VPDTPQNGFPVQVRVPFFEVIALPETKVKGLKAVFAYCFLRGNCTIHDYDKAERLLLAWPAELPQSRPSQCFP
jgi:hypothetical protein